MTNSNNAAKFAFYYLLSLVALVFMSLSTGMIIFQIINKFIVDVINEYSGRYSDEAMKFAISSIFIAAPIYYFVSRAIMQNIFSGKLDRESQIRKWLSYLILLISSVVMIGWLIGTLNSFLDGELTLKFFLKALTAVGISATIFSYYYLEIKRREVVGVKSKMVQSYFWGSLAVVVIVFVSALFIVESPREARDRKIDERILSTFNYIDNELNRYYNEKETLPENLKVLKEEYPYIEDDDFENPITKEQVEYRAVDGAKYELCANFRTSNRNIESDDRMYEDKWPHDKGDQCLKQKVYTDNHDDVLPLRLK